MSSLSQVKVVIKTFFPLMSRQDSVERFRSTTHPAGLRSSRRFPPCLCIVATPCHRSLGTTSWSPLTFGIPTGRGRCCRRRQTAPFTCGTGSTNRLPADQGKERTITHKTNVGTFGAPEQFKHFHKRHRPHLFLLSSFKQWCLSATLPFKLGLHSQASSSLPLCPLSYSTSSISSSPFNLHHHLTTIFSVPPLDMSKTPDL